MSDQITVLWVKCALDTEPRSILAAKAITAIRTGGKKLRGQVESLRSTIQRELTDHGDAKRAKQAASEQKKQLPAILWSGTFTRRANDALLQHSGLLCADLDGLNSSLPDVRQKLKGSPYLWLLFLSPSGDGLKAVFRCPADAANHTGSFRAVEQHVRGLTGVQIDQACKDVARLCFLSYDPDIYHNANARAIEPLAEPVKPRLALSGMVDLSERQRIATELLGTTDWLSETSGLLTCPGKHLHTSGDSARDCRVDFDGVPTVHCFHNSCRGILEGVNHELRSRIGKAESRVNRQNESTGLVGAGNGIVEPDRTIASLAALHPLEYERQREQKAKDMNCRAAVLDKLVEEKRRSGKQANSNLQGQTVVLPQVEPWGSKVDGVVVLDEIAESFRRYIALPDGAADALALWCAHTHCFKSFECSARLNFYSPEKGCGKTTARDVVALFVPRPILTENMSVAVLFRLVDAQAPVILADEYDAWIKFNEELRGLLNAGHRRGATVFRCEGDSNEVRQFNAFAPAVLCGIGTLPGTVHDRSIVIPLARAKPGELSKRFDSRRVDPEKVLNRKLARLVADKTTQLEAIDPVLPNGVFNRLADNWRPLFAVAEVVGGNWPQRCADAFTKLTSAASKAETDGLREMLLADIQGLFKTDRMFSRELIERLSGMTERPWPEVNRGKPITERWLARNLGVFGIHPKQLRIGEDNGRGYELADLVEAFERYLPNPAYTSVTPLQIEGKEPFSKCYKNENVTLVKMPFLEGCNTCNTCDTPEQVIDEAERLLNARKGAERGLP
jgi:putative DNA primase/helicase